MRRRDSFGLALIEFQLQRFDFLAVVSQGLPIQPVAHHHDDDAHQSHNRPSRTIRTTSIGFAGHFSSHFSTLNSSSRSLTSPRRSTALRRSFSTRRTTNHIALHGPLYMTPACSGLDAVCVGSFFTISLRSSRSAMAVFISDARALTWTLVFHANASAEQLRMLRTAYMITSTISPPLLWLLW